MHTNITSVLLASVLILSIVGLTTTNAIAQPFDITTEQQDQEALITVKLATNHTVVIPPNGTIIEVPGNITQIDNDTVVITPDNETVTETPGNVTVIDPPVPEPCGCPEPGNETGPIEPTGPIDPVIVTPAPGQEVITENGTELVANESQEEPVIPPVEGNITEPEPAPPMNDTLPIEPFPEPFPEPIQNETGGGGNGNETQGPTLPVEPEQNQTGNDTGGIEPLFINGLDIMLGPA